METRFRIEKVENGVIFTTPNDNRFVSPDINPATEEICRYISSVLEEKRDCAIIVFTPDEEPKPMPGNGCVSRGF